MSFSNAEEYAKCQAATSTAEIESKQTGHAKGQTSIVSCTSKDERDDADRGEKSRQGQRVDREKGRQGIGHVYLALQLLHALSGDLLL